MTHYHVHVTVPNNTIVPKGWKKTSILLEGDREQQDLMFTRHYVVEHAAVSKVLNNVLKDILENAACFGSSGVQRIKIEQEDDFFLPVNETTYAEIHMLCPDGVIPKGEGWVRSRNPKKEGAYFYNKRIYSAPSMEEVITETAIEQVEVSWMDLKIEQVVFDSNRERDRWWA